MIRMKLTHCVYYNPVICRALHLLLKHTHTHTSASFSLFLCLHLSSFCLGFRSPVHRYTFVSPSPRYFAIYYIPTFDHLFRFNYYDYFHFILLLCKLHKIFKYSFFIIIIFIFLIINEESLAVLVYSYMVYTC